MSVLLPGWADLRTLFAIAIAATAMVWGGRLLVGRRAAPELCLLAGWGALCLALTLWGTAVPATLHIPMAACFLLALLGCRHQGQVQGGIWQVALLTLPLWLVVLPTLPSQVDTWLNLLPNQAFLVDHAMLPRDGGPPSYSFLPAAPYDTQFAAFAASLVAGGLAPNALGLFNVLLLCAAGLKLARVAAGRDGLDDPLPLPWWAVAAGLLLAVPLNPGFVPRVFLAAYGEASLAVTTMFAVSLSAELLLAERRRAPIRLVLAGLALVLAAMVDVKQSAPGLVAPLLGCLLALGLACPGVRRWRWCALVAACAAPALLEYGAWRWFVSRHFAAGELKMLPAQAWQWRLLGGILRGMGRAMLAKPAYFLFLAAVPAGAAFAWRRAPWSRPAVLLALTSGVSALFAGFLLATYVAHFPPIWAVHAHSYFRYMSQLCLAAMLGLVAWLRPPAAAWLAGRSRQARRRLGQGAVACLLVLPAGLRPLLRFDLDAPQPALRALAGTAAPFLGDADTVALVTPGDLDDAVGSMLRGLLLFTPPRRPRLAFRAELTAEPAALADAAAAGARIALVTCAPPSGLAGLPPGTAGVLALRDGAWRVLAVRPYPPGFAAARFSAMMPHAPFCGVDRAPDTGLP